MTPEERLSKVLIPIEEALGKALADGAGEEMAYILLITPVGRAGEHIVTSNIIDHKVIIAFLRDAIKRLAKQREWMQRRFEKMQKKGMH